MNVSTYICFIETNYYTPSIWSQHPQYKARIQNSMYLQHTAIRHSHNNSSTQIEYIVTARIHGHNNFSTYLDYIITTPSVHS